MQPARLDRVNLGGEGEVPGALNQQGARVVHPGWTSSAGGETLEAPVVAGHAFLVCDNTAIQLPDGSADAVYTNSVPIDTVTWLGPSVQSSEVVRILKPGGVWYLDGSLYFTKP